MFLFFMIGCLLKDTNEPMCDAMCNESYIHQFSKPFSSYTLEVVYELDGEDATVQLSYVGETVNLNSALGEVYIRADHDRVQIYSSYGQVLNDIVLTINGEVVSSTLATSVPDELCGTVCTYSEFDVDTDSVEELELEVSSIEDLNDLISCSTSTDDLTIVARNDSRTHALYVHESEGLNSHGGYWENGGFYNPNLRVELHIGTNVGENYCTDAFLDEVIEELFLPIDSADLPSNIAVDDVITFDYGASFPECDGCVPYAMLHVENFWFVSSQGNYAKVALIDYLQSDILQNYGG